MYSGQLVLKIAFSMLRGCDADVARAMEGAGMGLDEFFSYDKQRLSEALGASPRSPFIEQMNRDEARFKAREELAFVERHRIRAHFLLDDSYPWKLREAKDAPLVVYQLGDTDLNAERTVAVVGTRRPSSRGMELTGKMVGDLAVYLPGTVIASGLAYGIDSAAHTAALDTGLPTVAVLAHGLQMIYPAQHRDLARRILHSGGSLLSEYRSGDIPYRQRFLERNRIVAGMSDATVVVESPVKGGAMSTANIAFSYSREVLAVPGRPSDETSAGCNLLIRRQKATLVTCAGDLMEAMGWTPEGVGMKMSQRNLFPELDGECRTVYDALRFSGEQMGVDELHVKTQLPVARVMSALGELEFEGIVARNPGNRYSLA